MTGSSFFTNPPLGRPRGQDPERDQPASLGLFALAGEERGGGDILLDALTASRSHWKAVADLAFDLSFETDHDGRFVQVSGPGFGWTANQLLGRRGASLLEWPDLDGFDPFRPHASCRRRRAWIRRADGGLATVLVSATPLFGQDGSVAGAIGGLQDISEQELRAQAVAEQLHTFRQVAAITRRMRCAVLPELVIRIGLDALMEAIGGYGAVITACEPAAKAGAVPGAAAPTPAILHRAGEAPPAADHEIIAMALAAGASAGARSTAPWSMVQPGFGRTLILSAIATHFCEPVILMLWREAGRGWTAADQALAAGFMANLGGVLEHDQVQRELARQSGTDALTGLLNRDNFAQEIGRRLDRLDAEGLAATLMVVGLDKFEAVNQRAGYERGDVLLRNAAQLLRDAVRPTDLAARLGGDIFALWLDGADQFAAAERAENLCKSGVNVALDEPVHLSLSIGLTTRPTRSFESIETLLEQAHAALGAIKLAGGGRWHFYNEGGAA